MLKNKGITIIKNRLSCSTLFLALVIVGSFGGIFWFSHDVQAASFTVNDLGDATDTNPGDSICETGVGNGVCTLRVAVAESNALGGSNTITFSVVGTIDKAARQAPMLGIGVLIAA